MVQQIINAIVPVAITAIVAMLVAVIKALGDAGVAYIQKKKDAVVTKIGADTYNHRLTVAKSIYGAVDEEFRITPTLDKTIVNKQAMFDEKIKKAIPNITDDEIAQLRQAVAGEVNKGKAAIVGQTEDIQGNGLGTASAPAAAVPSVAAVTPPAAPAPVVAPAAPAPQTPNA
jgi:hypothetical protein